ncbi:molybdopterin molybdotransferase MoeA [uncultured Campylobacter sp.]|uniref:molybdopterin molybdotransferase MoeA n=1 Tax=uncultured Campylobacter sp. TaxID=218934 RepID=UPI00261CFEDF|nr:molybdopterin molybdotransferase MoeA [uncultured Campylobacter sp.]
MDTFEAINFLKTKTKKIQEFELINLNDAKDRILFEDLRAEFDSPAFDNSALDGYAFAYANKDNPLKIKGSIFAGDLEEYKINDDECYKIMTGAKMPKNADTVLMLEDECLENGALIIKTDIKKFNVNRKKAEEFKKGEILLKKGTMLKASHIALLASQGKYKIKVFRKIKICIFSSGNELKEPFESKKDAQIYNANAYSIMAILNHPCFEINYKGIIQDTVSECKNAINTKDCDLIITSGAASVGEADFMKQALFELGFECLLSNIKAKFIKPSKFFAKDNKFVFVLPGNPISAIFSCFLLVKSFLFFTLEQSNFFAVKTCKFKGEINLKGGRNELFLGNIKDKHFIQSKQNSSYMLSILSKNEYLLISKIDKKEIKNDEDVSVIKLDF